MEQSPDSLCGKTSVGILMMSFCYVILCAVSAQFKVKQETLKLDLKSVLVCV